MRHSSSILRACLLGATLAACSDADTLTNVSPPTGPASSAVTPAAGSLQLTYMSDPGGNTFRIRNANAFSVTVHYRLEGAASKSKVDLPSSADYFVATDEPGTVELLFADSVVATAANGGAPAVAGPVCNAQPANIWPGAAGSFRVVTGGFDAPSSERWTLFGTDGDDVIVGSPLADRIRGNAGDDTLCGEGGRDDLLGGSGSNHLDGGAGNDTFGDELTSAVNTFVGGLGVDVLLVTSPGELVKVDLEAGTVQGGYYGGSTVQGIESLAVVTPTPVEFYGDTAANLLRGNAMGDVLMGRGGDDYLRGFGGADVIDGGAGNDEMEGNSGADTMDGGPGNDRLYGGSGANIIRGGDGDDRFGMRSETGANAFDGGPGVDILVTRSSTGMVTVDLQSGTVVGGNFNGSTVANIEDLLNGSPSQPVTFRGNSERNRFWGGDAADILEGREGKDQLHGGGGSDILRGGRHNDTLWGDGGADQFIGNHGRDHAVDFRPSAGDTAVQMETGV